MKNHSIAELYPILAIEKGGLISKNGSVTFCFRMEEPECYSLDREALDLRMKEFFRAFKGMGDRSVVHKQDLFIRKSFDSSVIRGDSFLQRAERDYFRGYPYLEHSCLLTFSMSGFSGLEKSYLKNPVAYKDGLVKSDTDRLSGFCDEVENAVAILNNLPNTSLRQLTDDELRNHILTCLNGLEESNGLCGLIFDRNIQIGEKTGGFFAFCDTSYLPDELSSYVKDESLPNANVNLFCSVLERLGGHLKYTHAINQYWQFDSHHKAELSHKVRQFGQHRNFDKEIARDYEGLDKLETGITNEGNIICNNHFNLFLLEESGFYEKASEEIKQQLKISGFRYYYPSYDGLQELFLASLPGNETKLRSDFWFLSDLQSSLCLMLNQSSFRQDEKGILFHDRLYTAPLYIDLWNGREGYRLPARNAIVFASTGGGKSVATLNLIQQYLEQGVKVVSIEFGKSFYQLTQIYQEDSLHIDYDEHTPLGINPFRIEEGAMATHEKIETLVNLILKFWRVRSVKEDTNQVVALRDLLIDYYQHTSHDHTFEGFYWYVKDQFEEVSGRIGLDRKYFDYSSFVHICKEFCAGGYYENVCKPSPIGDQVAQKNFVVFELSKIKKDPFLVSVIMSIMLDVIETKLLDRGSKGLLVFDEYAETQTLKDIFEDNSIHSTVAFCYQKLRKENSAVMTILQSPAQLADNEFSRGIIANTQIMMVLPTTETVYNSVVDAFQINNKSHIDLMKSQKNNFEGTNKYSEIFIRMGDLYAIVARLKLCPERFYAFQTDGETWKNLQREAEKSGIEQAIVKQIEKDYEKKTITVRL